MCKNYRGVYDLPKSMAVRCISVGVVYVMDNDACFSLELIETIPVHSPCLHEYADLWKGLLQ